MARCAEAARVASVKKMFHVLLSHVFVENVSAIKDLEKLMEQNCFWVIGGLGVGPDLVVK